MNRQRIRLLIIAIVALAANNACVGTETAFDTLTDFLKKHCTQCHGEVVQEAGLRLDQTERLDGATETAELWHSVLERVASGDMPPEDSPRLSDRQRKTALELVGLQLELSMARASAEGKWAYPNHGNVVPHEWLFPADDTAKPPAKVSSPPRIWRVSPQAYRQTTDELTRGFVGILRGKIQARGNPLVPAPFGLTTDSGFRDYAFRYRVAGSEVEQLARNAQMTVDLMLTQRGPRKVPPELRAVLETDLDITDELLASAVGYMFRSSLRREPRDNEPSRYIEFTRRNIQQLGRRKGLTLGLAAVLMHPEAVFRLELGRGEPDEYGRVMLSPLELAWAISHALTDQRPDESLMNAVRDGRLDSRDDVRREVRRILADEKISKPRILRFFQEYFGYTAAPSVFKDDHIIRQAGFLKYYPERLVEDTDRLVLHILESDRHVLRELLTTELSFVAVSSVPNWVKFAKRRADQAKEKGIEPPAHPFDKKNKVNQHYNFSPEDWSIDMPLRLAPNQRAGILTQPSWLIAFSTNEHNHAILRGKWIRERLLGGRIQDTPITVDAQLPNEPNETLRNRMRVTRDDDCWKCHQRMDPLGLPFQMFDHFGRFRAEEFGQPVDSSGEVVNSGDESLDGSVNDAVALVKRLSHSTRVEQVFVRHTFRYWMGRNESRQDAVVLQEAWQSYRKHDGSMRALIESLLTSDSFIYRNAISKTSGQ